MYASMVLVSGVFFAALGLAGVLKGEYRRLGRMAMPYWAVSWCAKGMPLHLGVVALLISVPYAAGVDGHPTLAGTLGLALAQLKTYAGKAQDVLARASRIIAPIQSSSGHTIYRARFGLFAEQEAREVCNRLTQRGQTCFAAVQTR